MRTGLVVAGVALMILGVGLTVFGYISGWLGDMYRVLIIAGPVTVVGLIVLVIGLVTGRRRSVYSMPAPSAGTGAICPRCGGGLPYVAGNTRCPYCGSKVMPLASAPVAYPLVRGPQVVMQQQPAPAPRGLSRFCRFCGAPIHPSSVFCQRCGRNLVA